MLRGERAKGEIPPGRLTFVKVRGRLYLPLFTTTCGPK